MTPPVMWCRCPYAGKRGVAHPAWSTPGCRAPVAKPPASDRPASGGPRRRWDELRSRHIAVIQGLADGRTRAQIARSLDVDVKRIDGLVRDVARAFETDNSAPHLVAVALRKGLIQ